MSKTITSGFFSRARRRPSSPSEAVTIWCPAFVNESSLARRRNLLSSIRRTVDTLSRYSAHRDCIASYDGLDNEPNPTRQQLRRTVAEIQVLGRNRRSD